jgi:hypothetical protein
VLRLLALELRHAALKPVLDFGRGEHRCWVAEAFAEPLGKLGPAARQGALDALVIATDVYAWKLLRRDLGRSMRDAAATLEFLVRTTLTEFSKTKPKQSKASKP